ncbi:TolC family protein [Salmonella enterica]|nr:efflux transporter outer membrane subunit [Salmonella enterica]EEP9145134.1 TolC family protein [Salmonella enterica]EEU3908442.1 TolC family protein [Salmonella enterica]EEU4806717.1 TolC family protein [Salmonella enterica]EEU4869859.1 TolC family protein [Salmonella enterica]
MRILFPPTLCLLVLFTVGCGSMVKSHYQKPQVNFPAHWQQDDTGIPPAPFDWRDFHDPLLDKWLQQVIISNNDLAVAVLRVYRARLEADRAGISTAPGVSATLNTGAGTALDKVSPVTRNSSASVSTNYEADLWGKLARQRDAAEWARQATEQDLQSARLALLANASNNYWRLGFISQQLTVLHQSTDYARETLRLADARHRAGSISSLDVVNAGQNVLAQENRLTALRRDRLQALNEQVLLLGVPPGSPVAEPSGLPTGPLPEINSRIPVSVLGRRPDVRAKELRLREALAGVDIKRTAYYPAFSLTGSLGTTSTALLAFLRNPTGSVGAALSLPFLEWRQMDVDIRIARNDYEQRVLEFRQSLYKAMTDIDDALTQRTQLTVQETHLRAALGLALQSERLNEVRYRQGAVPVTFWLDAQEQRRQAELALLENRFSQYRNLTQIWLEFGGSPQ